MRFWSKFQIIYINSSKKLMIQKTVFIFLSNFSLIFTTTFSIKKAEHPSTSQPNFTKKLFSWIKRANVRNNIKVMDPNGREAFSAPFSKSICADAQDHHLSVCHQQNTHLMAAPKDWSLAGFFFFFGCCRELERKDFCGMKMTNRVVPFGVRERASECDFANLTSSQCAERRDTCAALGVVSRATTLSRSGAASLCGARCAEINISSRRSTRNQRPKAAWKGQVCERGASRRGMNQPCWHTNTLSRTQSPHAPIDKIGPCGNAKRRRRATNPKNTNQPLWPFIPRGCAHLPRCRRDPPSAT